MKKYFSVILIVLIIILIVIGTIVFVSKKPVTKESLQTKVGSKLKDLTSGSIEICNTFSKEKISKFLGRSVTKTKSGLNEVNKKPSCFYYLEGEKTVYLELNQNSNVNDQTSGAKALGWKVEENSKIPLKNFVIYTAEGKVRFIYLIIDEKTFLSIDAWGTDLSNEEQINFATKLANYLKEEFGVK